MDLQFRLVALAATLGLFLLVLELVRRRRLLERYALVWLAAAGALVVLSQWTQLLQLVSDLIGIAYPPTALFAIAFGFVSLLLLDLSAAGSRQADQVKVLAQRLARAEERLSRVEAERRPQPAAENHPSPDPVREATTA